MSKFLTPCCQSMRGRNNFWKKLPISAKGKDYKKDSILSKSKFPKNVSFTLLKVLSGSAGILPFCIISIKMLNKKYSFWPQLSNLLNQLRCSPRREKHNPKFVVSKSSVCTLYLCFEMQTFNKDLNFARMF